MCLVVLFVVCFCRILIPPCWGVTVFCCASFDWLLGQISSDVKIFPVCPVGFCLESLILAQDERWRRA